MDSGNSSSMQSSSGGGGVGGDQEEYDSRADQSISALFNHNNTTTTVSSTVQLDSLIANYFNTAWSTENPLWSTTTTRPPPPISSSEPVFFTNPLLEENQKTVCSNSTNTNTTSPICSIPTDKKNGIATRNLKKRSRVSRRAPTTVLTTDTSNFRAMVQEFTGNPSTPFTGFSSSSSSFPRSRFDLFGSSSSSRPLKPYPQKLIPISTTSTPHYLIPPPPPSDYHHHHNLLNININTQNPFLNNHSPNNPLPNQSKPLSLGTSNGFGNMETNFEGLHNAIVSSTQPTLNMIHGDKYSEAENVNDMFRSINSNQSTVQRSDIATGAENNLTAVRNEGNVELSWISSSD